MAEKHGPNADKRHFSEACPVAPNGNHCPHGVNLNTEGAWVCCHCGWYLHTGLLTTKQKQ